MPGIALPIKPRRDNPEEGYLSVQQNVESLAGLFEAGVAPGDTLEWNDLLGRWVAIPATAPVVVPPIHDFSSAFRNTNLAMVGATYVPLTLNGGETLDEGGWHDVAVNPARFTNNYGTTIWIAAHCYIIPNGQTGTTVSTLRFVLYNAASVLQAVPGAQSNAVLNGEITLAITAFQMAAGNYIQAEFNANPTGSIGNVGFAQMNVLRIK